MQGLKLKDSTTTDFTILFNDLIILSGIKTESVEEMKELCEITYNFLLRSHPNTTIEEIRNAYTVGRQGKLAKKIFRELNYAAICDVLLEFEEYKKEQIGPFVQNQTLFQKPSAPVLSEHEVKLGMIEFLSESWTLAKNNEIDDLRGAMVYDYFKSEGIICLSDEEKIYIQETAIEFVKNKKEQLQKESVDIIFIRSISHFLNNITGKTEEVIVCSKKIALSYQIRNWILEEKTINDISQLLFLDPNRRLQ